MTLDGPDLQFKTRLDRRALDFIRTNKPGVAILPVIQNATAGNWDGAGLARLLADRARADQLLDQIIAFVAANKLQGVTVDFEEVPPAAHKDLEDFLSRMSAAFAPHDWIIAQAAPFDDDRLALSDLCRHRRLHHADGLSTRSMTRRPARLHRRPGLVRKDAGQAHAPAAGRLAPSSPRLLGL